MRAYVELEADHIEVQAFAVKHALDQVGISALSSSCE